MTRKSKRELERVLDDLTGERAEGETALNDADLSEPDKHDARSLLRYRYQVAADTGVHIDDRDALVNLISTARDDVGAGNVTVETLEDAADTIGFEARAEA